MAFLRLENLFRQEAMIKTFEKWTTPAAQNLFCLKYGKAQVCLKSINQSNFRKVEKSFIRRLQTIFHRLYKALHGYIY